MLLFMLMILWYIVGTFAWVLVRVPLGASSAAGEFDFRSFMGGDSLGWRTLRDRVWSGGSHLIVTTMNLAA